MTEILEEADIGNEDEASVPVKKARKGKDDPKSLPTIIKNTTIPKDMIVARLEEASKASKYPTPEDFYRVASSSGTHIIKFRNTRAKGIIRTKETWGNKPIRLVPYAVSRDLNTSKLVFGYVEVEGEVARSIADHIREPDRFTEELKKAFCAVFSEEHWNAIVEGLRSPPARDEEVYSNNFPIVFVPNKDGEDIQITPISASAAHLAMETDVIQPFKSSKDEGASRSARVDWSRQLLSAKNQNISPMDGAKYRYRFDAKFPDVMTTLQAEIYNYINGGRFPTLNEEWFREEVMRYADLIASSDSYSNMNIRRSLDNRSKSIIRSAKVFIDDILREVESCGKEVCDLTAPKVEDVIYSSFFWKDDVTKDKVRTALNRSHFKETLKKSAA